LRTFASLREPQHQFLRTSIYGSRKDEKVRKARKLPEAGFEHQLMEQAVKLGLYFFELAPQDLVSFDRVAAYFLIYISCHPS
jgi:hypothetical protein